MTPIINIDGSRFLYSIQPVQRGGILLIPLNMFDGEKSRMYFFYATVNMMIVARCQEINQYVQHWRASHIINIDDRRD